ncbi:MAG: CMP-N,N'-diacetyllegionaminic acid synthase [candidate division WS2 bacterium ADurb.Bin280]|uniref:CMP-N,N'-diacetyllegionaminic acid synthase n=1 Tax=candidate division WS2 bacterium ADurb.Bin280 TaxID=1852829 RepID=A0A1V5SBE6_9BACT|nr:MAG: CMP-N,N'-diacetyllegionaminic acid synthase [candidate division WS2 bacterium ADurb.Bin280]
MKVLAIIPARSGSKSVKDKNIAEVGGSPLLALAVRPAVALKKKGLIDRVIISTDSQKYADIAIANGAEAPFLRPEEISGDNSKSIDLILHAIDYYKKLDQIFDAVLLLQPTSPFRTEADLEKAIKILAEKEGESLISCYLEEYINPLVMYRKQPDNFLQPLNKLHNKGVRRQEHGGIYVRNGAIYLTRTQYLEKTKQIISDKPLLLEMKKIYSVNVDGPEDLELARRVYENWNR